MKSEVKTVAVIGSGIMGAGIGAFFADRGIDVQLYDLEKSIVDKSLEQLVDPKNKFPLIMTKRSVNRMKAYGLDAQAEQLPKADLIIEVVPEVMKIKKRAFEAIDNARREGAIVASNTSGLSLAQMAEGRSEDFKKHFLGVHFFNPVRYMDLVELIPTDQTDPAIVEAMRAFFAQAGKAPIVGRDTPNFVANRVGIFSMMKVLQLRAKYGLSVEEIDTVTGPPMGNPKTGTFRLADMVGIDTLVHAATNSYENCPDDEARDIFKPPPMLERLIEEKKLGDKTGEGFYKKAKDDQGKRVILALDLDDFTYKPAKQIRADAIRVAKSYSKAGDKVKALVTYDDTDKYTQFARELIAATGAYALNRVGEIAGDPQTIDEALRAGFGRNFGPIELLDIIGLDRAKRYMEALRIPVPKALTEALEAGRPLSPRPAPPEAAIVLKDLPEEGRLVRENLSARLLDLGDGVLCCEFDTKMVPTMNPVDDYIVSMIAQAHEEIYSGRFKALVIGNQAQNFCAGANLMMILELAKAKRFKEIDMVSRALQTVNVMNLHAPFPVVTAPHRMTLGGGHEITMGGQKRVALAELYCGLVEVGVGLVPAGAGCYFLLRQMVERMKKRNPGPMPVVKSAFELIGFGTVSSSAFDAIEKGLLLKSDEVVFSKTEQIARAKQAALGMLEGFKPIPKEPLVLPGQAGLLAIEQQVDDMLKLKKISEHSAKIARIQGRILTGGAKASIVDPVSPDAILDLEREAFLELCGEPKSQERMAYMLKNGKPLIN